MKRIYEPLAYSDHPIRENFWASTIAGYRPKYPSLQGAVRTECAVVGGGYTGLSAALTLAEAGADVVLLDANTPGWGASGRAGGLVSTGSAKIDDIDIVKKHGQADARVFFDAERASVDLVEEYLDKYHLDVDRHSKGYTYVAHRPDAVAGLKDYGAEYTARYGLPTNLCQNTKWRIMV